MPILRPMALFSLATLILAAQPVARTATLPNGVTVHENVAYDKYPETVMDIFRPVGAGPFPAVIIIHGGGWTAGTKEAMLGNWV